MNTQHTLLLALASCAAWQPAHRPRGRGVAPHRATRLTSRATRLTTDEQFVDEEALLAASTFPITPKELIEKCKDVIRAQAQLQDAENFDESIYADDFRFCAPFVGGATPASAADPMPGMGKQQFLASLRAFDLLEAFPNMNNNYHFFRVDPFETNRVWFQTRATATHTGPLMGSEATGKRLELPPQAFSMTFNEEGQVTLFNVGYVIDRTVGNTGGLGGAFGFFWGTGNPLPIPECQPFTPSLQFRALNFLQSLLPSGD
mmetsp:Transcript_8629/g.25966  ORF Transcript_8629/g.25966 Transcript_8629/m.25966 type:complete len:260 (+) Transcript_8629:212-991(+)